MKSSEQIRQEFLSFFEDKDHTIVPSASLVPADDPTLLFTNAGMNQFKDVFLGTGERPYVRAADTQKCLRVSGKHNDLEEVGYDTYHHTFFEMLGNWSFGDYFKKEAISWAWELLTEVWGLDPDRLYATVHEGDTTLGLKADEEAAAIWTSETSIESDHILYCPSKDNFWMMGDTGPCGPCSEIHIDLRSDAERERVPGRTLVNADDPEVIEIWNLVFIQYNALGNDQLKPLAAQHVDTGMGFERIVAVLQGSSSTYDTDLFAPLLAKTAALSTLDGIDGYDALDTLPETEQERVRIALRVVADHIRTIALAIGDGVMPGNSGRGYVIRRILRRAVRYGYQTLGLKEPFLYTLVEPLQQKMSSQFQTLRQQQAFIERVIKAEEESFLETLGTGLVIVERVVPYIEALGADEAEARRPEVLSQLRDDRATIDLLEKAYVDLDATNEIVRAFAETATQRHLPGEIAFLLHDTYGFPIDLTQLLAREHNVGVEMEAYHELMAQQKERGRAAAAFKVDQSSTDAWQTVRSGESTFVGYETTSREEAHILAVRSIEQDESTRVEVVLDATPFYAESGGQVGDRGVLLVGDEEIHVLDTQKQQDRIVHVLDRMPAVLDAPVEARVDEIRRQRIQKHHSATHLLHAALREELGTHVQQKGSLVAPDRLRFDFSHFERVAPETLRGLEDRINAIIQRNIQRKEERGVSFDEARARGAMALFGEKYGDKVRVITFDPDYSVELCGGTHVGATGEIGLFKFTSEGSVAAGVRRVEAVVGMDAWRLIEDRLQALQRAEGVFKNLSMPLHEEIEQVLEEKRDMEKSLETMALQQLEQELTSFLSNAQQVDTMHLVTGEVAGTTMDRLRDLGQTLRDRLPERSVGVLGTKDMEESKVYLVAVVTDDLVSEGIKAGALVGALARHVGGGGGGRPTLATAGGRQPEHLSKALAAASDVLSGMS